MEPVVVVTVIVMKSVVDVIAVVSAASHERFELVNNFQLDVIDALLFFNILPSAVHCPR
ncbi:protein of unknown function (plasmid) [Caballeronia sp. S22]